MSDLTLCYMTAEEALKRFRNKSLSPVELMKATIDRIEDINPRLNAVTQKFYDKALKEAVEAEKKYLNGSARALEGIPYAVKELHPVKGFVATMGSRIFEHTVADHTLPGIQRMLDAGAIMHVRTNTPEFAHACHCHNLVHGTTYNPWNLEYSPGGSSGGSAVAIATGMATLASADDGAGSIRNPSSACGVFGFKPPYGRNPGRLLDTMFEYIIHFGTITRNVNDTAIAQNVLNGQYSRDITTLPGHLEYPLESNELGGLRVAFSPNLGYFEVDKEVDQNTRKAVKELEALGCVVEEIKLNWTEEAYDAIITHWESLFAAFTEQYLVRWQYEMDPFVRKIMTNGLRYSATRVKQTEFVRTRMWDELASVFERYDVLVCPTASVAAVRANHRNDDPEFAVNGKKIDAYFAWCMTYPFNLLSQCPAGSVPSGFNSANLPTGLQIVGKPYDDLNVMRVARAYQAKTRWHEKHPKL